MGGYLNFGRFGGGGSATSIEAVETTLPATGTAGPHTTTVNLTKGQNPAQCVPFATWRGDDVTTWDAMSKSGIDITIIDNGGTPAVRFERREDTDSGIHISCYVLELNDDFSVQQISYGDPVSGQNFTVACSSVDTGHAFLIDYARRTVNGSLFGTNVYSAKVTFNSPTQVQFTRQASATDVKGTLYVVEDTSQSHFSVQTASSSQTNTGTYDVSITAIDKAASFVVGSFGTNDTGVANDHAFTAELLDTDTVRFVVRGDSGEVRDMHAQVITWLDGSVAVQHISADHVCDTTENIETDNVVITDVDEEKSILFGTSKSWMNLNALVDTHSNVQPATMARCRIASGGGSVNIERLTNTTAVTSRFRGWVAEFTL